MLNYILLGIIYILIFFGLGFIIIEIFFRKLPSRIKIPLYFVSSILFSTYYIYIIASLFGFTKVVVITCFIALLPLFVYVFVNNYRPLIKTIIEDKFIIVIPTFFFTLFLIVLSPAIMSEHNGYYVMSGPNWQDTAMHLSISESIAQNNFPPQTPFFSGHKLNYYYFVDMHSAIISAVNINFNPSPFIISNSLFASIFSLTVYMFGLQITKSRFASLFSSLLSTLFGSYHFVYLVRSLSNGEKFLDLIRNNSYSMQYNQIFGMANMADYFLQNRPMMVGLSTFVVSISLLFYAYENKRYKYIFLSGIVSALLVKFQLFSLVSVFVAHAVLFLVNYRELEIKKVLKYLLAYLFIHLGLIILFLVNFSAGHGLSDIFKNTFRFGFWDNTKPAVWHAQFVLLNLGLPFLISVAAPFFFKKSKVLVALFVTTLILVVIPLSVLFTIAPIDMLKFFYFAIPLISILCFATIFKLTPRISSFTKVIITIFVLLSTLSSFLTLTHSYYNKNHGYSIGEYLAGLWVRENTPKKSVFLTYPSVHSGVSDVAGRIRVLSYINWPYSHGFNVGEDNVFSRVEDINTFYSDPENNKNVLDKYNVDYVYFGSEERSNFPESENKLESTKFLEKVYDWEESIKIYRTE